MHSCLCVGADWKGLINGAYIRSHKSTWFAFECEPIGEIDLCRSEIFVSGWLVRYLVRFRDVPLLQLMRAMQFVSC